MKTATRHLLPRAEHHHVAARRRRRIIGRADDPAIGLEDRENLAASKGVVAQRNAVDARGQQVVVDFGRQSRPAGRVLGVGHHQIEPLLLAQPAHGLGADLPARLAHDVADQEDSHGRDRDWGLVACRYGRVKIANSTAFGAAAANNLQFQI